MVLAWLALVAWPLGMAAQSDPAVSRPDLQRQITDLGGQTYAARQAAQERLLKIGDRDCQLVLDECLRVYRVTDDPEVKFRLRTVMAELVGTHIFTKPRGFLGIQFRPGAVVEQDGHALHPIDILMVVKDGPGMAAGLLAGDRILKIDQLDFEKQRPTEAIVDYIQSHAPGESLTLTVKRGDQPLVIAVKLGELPDELKKLAYTDDKKRAFFETWLQVHLYWPDGRPGGSSAP